jgi:hypothetical protein
MGGLNRVKRRIKNINRRWPEMAEKHSFILFWNKSILKIANFGQILAKDYWHGYNSKWTENDFILFRNVTTELFRNEKNRLYVGNINGIESGLYLNS